MSVHREMGLKQARRILRDLAMKYNHPLSYTLHIDKQTPTGNGGMLVEAMLARPPSCEDYNGYFDAELTVSTLEQACGRKVGDVRASYVNWNDDTLRRIRVTYVAYEVDPDNVFGFLAKYFSSSVFGALPDSGAHRRVSARRSVVQRHALPDSEDEQNEGSTDGSSYLSLC